MSLNARSSALVTSHTVMDPTPVRERKRDRRASETVELGEERLCVQRECDRTRRAARSKEERESALLRMRAYSRSRVASGTADETGPLAAITYETVGWRD